MPKVGDKEFDYTPEGMEQAKDFAEATGQAVDYAPGGTSDGAMRSVTDYAGGGKTGYSTIGAEKPMYKEGGETPDSKNLNERLKKATMKLSDENLARKMAAEAALEGYINVKDIVKSKQKKKKKKK